MDGQAGNQSWELCSGLDIGLFAWTVLKCLKAIVANPNSNCEVKKTKTKQETNTNNHYAMCLANKTVYISVALGNDS